MFHIVKDGGQVKTIMMESFPETTKLWSEIYLNED